MKRSGSAAETMVVDYLEARGFQVLARNWRNYQCEIDIVARKQRRVHIVEVKSRVDKRYGRGYEYVTAQKQRRLCRAAAFWVREHAWEGDYCIDIASVDGVGGEITYLENAVTSG